jgi:hypothetical protein
MVTKRGSFLGSPFFKMGCPFSDREIEGDDVIRIVPSIGKWATHFVRWVAHFLTLLTPDSRPKKWATHFLRWVAHFPIVTSRSLTFTYDRKMGSPS